MELSKALGVEEGGIITCVGAGGKTSLLLSLAKEWQESPTPFLLTTTTKMFFWQVKELYPAFTGDFARGESWVRDSLAKHGRAGWFSRWRGSKVEGLPPHWIDKLFLKQIAPAILVEGDGARRKLLKVPREGEPVIPLETKITLGILNLNSLGQPFSPELVHRYELAEKLVNKKQGAPLTTQDLALLAVHPAGIFKGARGYKVLVLTGGSLAKRNHLREIAQSLKETENSDITRIILTEGFGSQMKALEVMLL